MKRIIFLLVAAIVVTVATAQSGADTNALSKEEIQAKKLNDKLAAAELKLEKVKQQIVVQDSPC
jgi:hypothetical protein